MNILDFIKSAAPAYAAGGSSMMTSMAKNPYAQAIPNTIAGGLTGGPMGAVTGGLAPFHQPAPGAMESMIPTMQNLEEFRGKMKNSYGAYLKNGFDPHTAMAAAYMETRYPMRMGTINNLIAKPSRNPDLSGLASPLLDGSGLTTVKVFPEAIKSNAQYDQMNPTEATVNTLGHESQHAADWKRANTAARYDPASTSWKAAQHIASKKFLTKLPVGNSPDYEAYYNQPGEVSAWQAGNTALQGYRKYLKMIIDHIDSISEGTPQETPTKPVMSVKQNAQSESLGRSSRPTIKGGSQR
jgi:hypothetical protein